MGHAHLNGVFIPSITGKIAEITKTRLFGRMYVYCRGTISKQWQKDTA